jgi:hypothetical protein
MFAIICDEYWKYVGKFTMKNAVFKMFGAVEAPSAVLHSYCSF